jgi:hypothetical protein
MIATVGIGSTNQKPKDLEQLPILRIYETREGEFVFLERTVIEEAIALSLNKLKEGQLSVVLIEVQIVPISQRRAISRGRMRGGRK